MQHGPALAGRGETQGTAGVQGNLQMCGQYRLPKETCLGIKNIDHVGSSGRASQIVAPEENWAKHHL